MNLEEQIVEPDSLGLLHPLLPDAEFGFHETAFYRSVLTGIIERVGITRAARRAVTSGIAFRRSGIV
jgi:hypothetical protein